MRPGEDNAKRHLPGRWNNVGTPKGTPKPKPRSEYDRKPRAGNPPNTNVLRTAQGSLNYVLPRSVVIRCLTNLLVPNQDTGKTPTCQSNTLQDVPARVRLPAANGSITVEFHQK